MTQRVSVYVVIYIYKSYICSCFCLTKMNRIIMIWSLQKHRDCLNMLRSNLSFAKGQTNNSWAPKMWSITQPLNWVLLSKTEVPNDIVFQQLQLGFCHSSLGPQGCEWHDACCDLRSLSWDIDCKFVTYAFLYRTIQMIQKKNFPRQNTSPHFQLLELERLANSDPAQWNHSMDNFAIDLRPFPTWQDDLLKLQVRPRNNMWYMESLTHRQFVNLTPRRSQSVDSESSS